MILEFKIKNFLSFKEEVIFSFEATKDKSFEDYQVVKVAPNTRILRLAIVYGANASGKSNLLEAFDFLTSFWLNIPEDKDKLTGVIPFLLDKEMPQTPSELSLAFYIEGVKHLYSLVLDKEKVISEKLFIYPKTQPALLFERKLNGNISEITFNSKRVNMSEAAKNEITVKCLLNMSVLAAYNKVNVTVPEIDNVIQWIKTKCSLQAIEPRTRLFEYAENMIAKNELIKKHMLNFLHEADYNIADIHTEETEKKVPEEILPLLKELGNLIEDDQKKLESTNTIKLTKTEFVHKVITQEGISEQYKMPKDLQSTGTIRTLGISTVINQLIEKNAFLTIDEIESSLHPRLVEFIIEDFFKQKGQSQLLLTTHYDGLLEEDDLLRKDSIWFTNKKGNGVTELYSLADFKGLNRITSLQKAYKFGKFGATPNI